MLTHRLLVAQVMILLHQAVEERLAGRAPHRLQLDGLQFAQRRRQWRWGRMGRWQRWTRLYLPAIFPYLVVGLITAAGGAWNATIVSEYVQVKDQTFTAFGLGSLISIVLLGGLFALRRKDGFRLPTIRGAFIRTAAVTLVCLFIAMIGSAALRHNGPPRKATSPALSNGH